MKLIVAAILLCISCLAQADEIFCINLESGTLYLFVDHSALLVTPTKRTLEARWEAQGQWFVGVIFADGDQKSYPTIRVQTCEPLI